jgi:hypothetical protein
MIYSLVPLLYLPVGPRYHIFPLDAWSAVAMSIGVPSPGCDTEVAGPSIRSGIVDASIMVW